jgi:hypothetical protein
MFFRGSRYEVVAEAELITANGRVIRYKRVRFITEVSGGLPCQVASGDRLDLIAYRYYQDPEQFWRICDANLALRPEDLTAEPGRLLVIPLPQG